eukprot:Rhum_TRINITY_DN14385_c25_g1::Rhum_TRINITY_DN14385_c25_g1_i1::g.86193::m.86193
MEVGVAVQVGLACAAALVLIGLAVWCAIRQGLCCCGGAAEEDDDSDYYDPSFVTEPYPIWTGMEEDDGRGRAVVTAEQSRTFRLLLEATRMRRSEGEGGCFEDDCHCPICMDLVSLTAGTTAGFRSADVSSAPPSPAETEKTAVSHCPYGDDDDDDGDSECDEGSSGAAGMDGASEGATGGVLSLSSSDNAESPVPSRGPQQQQGRVGAPSADGDDKSRADNTSQPPQSPPFFTSAIRRNFWCVLPCRHMFHARCLETWLRTEASYYQEASCPLCRIFLKDTVTIDVDAGGDDDEGVTVA